MSIVDGIPLVYGGSPCGVGSQNIIMWARRREPRRQQSQQTGGLNDSPNVTTTNSAVPATSREAQQSKSYCLVRIIRGPVKGVDCGMQWEHQVTLAVIHDK